MRLTRLGLTVGAGLALGLLAQTAQAQQEALVRQDLRRGLAVYARPGGGQAVARLRPGARVRVLRRQGQWLRIDAPAFLDPRSPLTFSGQTELVARGQLVLRAGPDVRAPAIAQLQPGRRLRLVGQRHGWYVVPGFAFVEAAGLTITNSGAYAHDPGLPGRPQLPSLGRRPQLHPPPDRFAGHRLEGEGEAPLPQRDPLGSPPSVFEESRGIRGLLAGEPPRGGRAVGPRFRVKKGRAKTVVIRQLSGGALQFTSKMSICADGDGDAWRGDPWGQGQTALKFTNGRYCNPTTQNYSVLPIGFERHFPQVKLGDVVAVTYRGQTAFSIYGDRGPREVVGEGSIRLARELRIPSSPVNGGVGSGVTYTIFPRSGRGRRYVTQSEIDRLGRGLFARLR